MFEFKHFCIPSKFQTVTGQIFAGQNSALSPVVSWLTWRLWTPKIWRELRKIWFPKKLVGGLEHFLFSHILGIIIPIDFHIFQGCWNHQPVWHIMASGFQDSVLTAIGGARWSQLQDSDKDGHVSFDEFIHYVGKLGEGMGMSSEV